MAARLTLSDESFIRHIFQPSKNPLPVGLKKRHASHGKGRVARRVRSFNKLAPKQQYILDKTGQREAYLRGDVTVAAARQRLRNEGIREGWAKPPRPRISLNDRVVDHIATTQYRHTGRMPDAQNLRARVERMTPEQKAKAVDITWTNLIKAAKDRSQMRPPPATPSIGLGGDDYDEEGDDYYPDDDINPFWYND